jgi:hypothetical protein
VLGMNRRIVVLDRLFVIGQWSFVIGHAMKKMTNDQASS